ncbi:MAG: hypothetical protein RBQ97_03805 [Acholeplasma sp.]|nr:hypothetical protein [Acholeplasma sp.]
MKKKTIKKRIRYHVSITILLFIVQVGTYITHFVVEDELPFYNLGSFIGYNMFAILGVINLILVLKREKQSKEDTLIKNQTNTK